MIPSNVLSDHSKHLMGYFEFLHSHSSQSLRRQRLIVFVFVNTIQYPYNLKNNIYHWSKRGLPPFFHSNTNPVLGHILGHSIDGTHVLVVIVESIWSLFLNMLSFNFVTTPNKSLRFTNFRRTYVNRPVVVLTNHCQSYPTFLLDVRCSKRSRYFFCSCLSPMIVHLRNLFLLSTPVTRKLLTPRLVSIRKDVKSCP